MVAILDNAFNNSRIQNNIPAQKASAPNASAFKIPIKKAATAAKKNPRVLNLNLIKASLKKANNGVKPPTNPVKTTANIQREKIEMERQRAFNQLMNRMQNFYRVPKAITPIKEFKEDKASDKKFDYSLYEIDSSFLYTTPKGKPRQSLKMKIKRVGMSKGYQAENLNTTNGQRLIDDELRRMIDNFADNVEMIVNEIQKEKRLSVGGV